MSQSPDSLQDREGLDAYGQAFQAVIQLLREGRSFSGNERNCAYLNCRRAPFANVSAATGLDFPDDGRGIAVSDWDQDGDLDLWIRNRTGPRLRLMLNQSIAVRQQWPGASVICDPATARRRVESRCDWSSRNGETVAS